MSDKNREPGYYRNVIGTITRVEHTINIEQGTKQEIVAEYIRAIPKNAILTGITDIVPGNRMLALTFTEETNHKTVSTTPIVARHTSEQDVFDSIFSHHSVEPQKQKRDIFYDKDPKLLLWQINNGILTRELIRYGEQVYLKIKDLFYIKYFYWHLHAERNYLKLCIVPKNESNNGDLSEVICNLDIALNHTLSYIYISDDPITLQPISTDYVYDLEKMCNE